MRYNTLVCARNQTTTHTQYICTYWVYFEAIPEVILGQFMHYRIHDPH